MLARPRIALVGAGAMGSRHARIVAQSDHADLGVVVDPDRVLGSRIADQFGSRWAPSLDDVDLAACDGVLIAAPTEHHPALAAQVLAASRPLFIEKPIAAGLPETLTIIEASRAAGTPLMCGFVERFNPAVRTARALLDAPVHIAAIRHSPYAPRMRTGVAWDLLVHDVDLVCMIFGGTPIDLEGFRAQFDPRSFEGSEDVAEVLLRFEGGGVGHVSASRVSQRKVRALHIGELDRLIEVDLLRRDVTIYRNVADQPADLEGRGYRQETIIEIPEVISSAEPLAAQFSHFLGLLAGDVDADVERDSIVAAHEVVARLVERPN